MPFARFILTGVLNTGLTYALYLSLLETVSYQVAYTIAFIAGILFSYLLSAKFVFRAELTLKNFFNFPLVYVAQFFLGLVLVTFLTEILLVPAWLAPLFVVLLTVPLTFALSRTIFSSPKQLEVDSVS